MLEDVESWGFGAGDPLLHLSVDLGFRVVSSGHSPISRVVRPWHGLEAKDALGDRSHSVVDITERRPPVFGDSTTVQIGNDLHSPSKLGEDTLV
jgi:hypothetical protein